MSERLVTMGRKKMSFIRQKPRSRPRAQWWVGHLPRVVGRLNEKNSPDLTSGFKLHMNCDILNQIAALV